MSDFVIQWWMAAIFGLVFGYIVSTIKNKAKVNREMINCTNDRLDNQEKITTLVLKKLIMDTYNKYKSKKKIPEYEMELADEFYAQYSKKDPNGVMLKRIEDMRNWATSEDKE